MRKFLFGMAALLACATMFSACSDDKTDDPGKGEDKSDKMAKFLTYGFFADDNKGLTKDYVVEIGSEMVIRLPADTDKTKLVARFTTSEGDMVTIGTKAQVSGETANDFSYPIDYIVKDEEAKLSSSYTVKVGKILTQVWSQVASYAQAADGATLVNNDFAMAICPKTKIPYFFLARTNAAGIDAGVVVKLNDGVMTPSSEISFAVDGTTAVNAKYPAIAIDADGKVYAMYYYSASNTATDGRMFVKTGSGASWSMVGSAFGSVTSGSYYTLGIDPATKRPLAGYQANQAGAGIARRELNMCYYDGAVWTSENTIPDLAGKTIVNSLLREQNGTLYLGGAVQTAPGTYFIYKYTNGTWEKVISSVPEGASGVSLFNQTFAVATDGTVYLCCGSDEDLSATYKISVYKAAPGAEAWTRVSTVVEATKLATASRYQLDLRLDQPVVFYKDPTTSLPMIVTLDPETKQWDTAIPLGSTKTALKDIRMEFDSNGVGYAAFLDDSDAKALTVYKFDTEADDLPK